MNPIYEIQLFHTRKDSFPESVVNRDPIFYGWSLAYRASGPPGEIGERRFGAGYDFAGDHFVGSYGFEKGFGIVERIACALEMKGAQEFNGGIGASESGGFASRPRAHRFRLWLSVLLITWVRSNTKGYLLS